MQVSVVTQTVLWMYLNLSDTIEWIMSFRVYVKRSTDIRLQTFEQKTRFGFGFWCWSIQLSNLAFSSAIGDVGELFKYI